MLVSKKGILLLVAVSFLVGRAEVYAQERQACITVFACDEHTGELLPDYAADTESPCFREFQDQCEAYKNYLAENRAEACQSQSAEQQLEIDRLGKENARLKKRLKNRKRSTKRQ